MERREYNLSRPEGTDSGKGAVTTTLWDLMKEINEQTGSSDDHLVAEIVRDILDKGRARFGQG